MAQEAEVTPHEGEAIAGLVIADTAMQAAALTLQGRFTHAQLHSGAPGAAGTANVCKLADGTTDAPRKVIAWGAPTGPGTFTTTAAIAWSGATALVPSEPTTNITLWNALTGGVLEGTFTLTGDVTANSAGEYTITSITFTGSTT